MAVSFKVPASPKRSIFNIDEFLGVDLTNTGANIDEIRSPNAENMIRYVPGKVRKRTGYENYIQFGTPTNVNRALKTSYKEQRFELERRVPGTTDNYTKLYDLSIVIPANTVIYYEFDYKAETWFWIGQYNEWIPAAEEYTHFSGSISRSGATGFINAISTSEGPETQTIYIKNFSLMTDKDANYKYKKAPGYFVERATDDPVYGVHVGKTGTYEGNRVVNVNRALGTKDTYDTFTVSHDGGWTDMYSMAEPIYNGRKLYIEFDYILTGDDASIWIGGPIINLSQTDTMQHYSGTVTETVVNYNTRIMAVGATSGLTATLQIRNFSVMYDYNFETYDWTAAPEDNGGTFPIEDIYLVGSKNYATSETFDLASSTYNNVREEKEEITSADSHVDGFCRVAFDLHTASEKPLVNLKVRVLYHNSETDTDYYVWEEVSTEHITSKHYDLYVYAPVSYISKISVTYELASNGQCWTYISNIKVNEITPRTSYDISPKWYIYHVGSDFYLRASNSKDFTRVYTNANRHLSKSWQFNNTLYILDGKDIYAYAIGDETVTPIGEENGYIPTLTIARSPSGGGIDYEPLNMLQPGFIEMFEGTATATNFQLSFGNLDMTPVKVWVMNSNGGWDEKTEGTHFTVNRGAGWVAFNSAPGVSPITGEDNIKIQAYRTVPGYRERITNCTNGTLFGVGGAEDRLFLTGNPDYPNWDFYSEQYNPTYFPDTGYSALGSEQSSIVGYAIVNNYLATFKDGFDTSQSVFIREGDLIVEEKNIGDQTYQLSKPAFKLINTLQGHGVVAPYAFGYLQTEPLFLTKSGVYAITAQDITGEKYSQNRSFYLNGKLTEENNLENAVAAVHNDMYILAVNNQLYVLDGLQATRTDRSEPYATRQYVGFHCTGVPAVCIWTDEGVLFFGTNDGKICRFHTDIESLDSYNDDGDPIYCCWETPDLDGKLFYKNKTFRYFAIRMMKALRTSVKMYTQKLGTWSAEPVKEDTASGVVFDFENIDFELFSFSTDRSEKVVHTKIRVKKADKARFKLVNENMDEPFGLFDLALEYIESGNYKG